MPKMVNSIPSVAGECMVKNRDTIIYNTRRGRRLFKSIYQANLIQKCSEPIYRLCEQLVEIIDHLV